MSDQRRTMPQPPDFIGPEDWGLWGQICYAVVDLKNHPEKEFLDLDLVSLGDYGEETEKMYGMYTEASRWYTKQDEIARVRTKFEAGTKNRLPSHMR